MTITIVGGETLLGREVREGLRGRHIRADVQLVAAEEQISVLSEADDEPVVVSAMNAAQLVGSDIIFCTGSRESTRKAFELARRGNSVFVDLSYALEEEPTARLFSLPAPAEPAETPEPVIHIVPHPAATALALLLDKLSAVAPVVHCVANVFEPASERGQAGINELQQQTTALLSFRPLEKKVFDHQIAFNMLARFGDDAPEHLEDVEERIERHLTTLLHATPGSSALPSLRVVQAPVFHGYSMSLWVQFQARPDLRVIGEQLASAGLDVRGADLEPPTNVGAAGQSGVAVGLIEADRNHPAGLWLWAVADNFRVMADTAIAAVLPHLGVSG